MSGFTNQTLIELAKVAEQAERYDDMAEFMRKLVVENGRKELLDEERNLLSVAYKNIVGSRRTSYRVLENCLETMEGKSDDENVNVKCCKHYKEKVVKELNDICCTVVKLLDEHLIKAVEKVPPTGSADRDNVASSLIFYEKMKGDYFRYQVEVETNENERDMLAKKSEQAYEAATRVASDNLKATHPIRLGLALNFSVFYYEIKNERQRAMQLAKDAFAAAIEELDACDGGSDDYKDSTLILQLLRDNLTLWSTAEEQEQDD